MNHQIEEKIAISIVTYNSPEYVKRCLDSILWIADTPNLKVFIFDNSSGNDVKDLVSKYPSLNTHYLKSETNLGFGAGHNRNFGESVSWQPDYFLLLNPDLIIEQKDLSMMLHSFKNIESKKIGIIGPKLKDGSGEIENSILFDEGAIQLGFMLFKEMLGFRRKNKKLPSTVKSVDGVSGACMLIDTDMIRDIGFFDERYFMYHEDRDLCFRARSKGWDIRYDPTVELIHYLGKSSENLPDRERWLKKRMLLSYLIFFRKHKGWLETWLLKQIWLTGLFLRIILKKDPEWARGMSKEIWMFKLRGK